MNERLEALAASFQEQFNREKEEFEQAVSEGRYFAAIQNHGASIVAAQEMASEAEKMRRRVEVHGTARGIRDTRARAVEMVLSPGFSPSSTSQMQNALTVARLEAWRVFIMSIDNYLDSLGELQGGE